MTAPRTTCNLSISLDGFIAGPDQSRADPIGVGGMPLHDWHSDTFDAGNEADVIARDDLMQDRGAVIMGRNMYGPIRGQWDEDWRGWWGAEPPYHSPVFVLTHYEHPPIEMAGGTTFFFVTGGFAAAFDQAKEAASEKGDIRIAGGASTVRQALQAGAVDELFLNLIPILLGTGERIFDGVPDPGFRPAEVLHSRHATHIRYVLDHLAR
ncbi:MAG: 5-amino-6-(5-phosphoribosylamino)uracil reductase [Pseudonocardiales bacterium]|nr:MAG: 5-amino-6-(5-phosphoribosylamino)uracil reductase [Pseudonocardiales bacterium]